MRIFSLVLCVGLLSGCKSLSSAVKDNLESTSQTQWMSERLPPQTLEKDECGLFLFTTGEPRLFVFFQKQGQSDALLRDGQTSLHLQSGTPLQDLFLAEQIDLSYVATDGQRLLLSGTFEDDLQEGRRVRALLKAQKPEGWQKITPLAGVYACKK